VVLRALNLNINSSSLVGHRFLVLLMGLVVLVVSYLPFSRSSDDLLFDLYMGFLPATEFESQAAIIALDGLVPASGEPVSNTQLADLINKLNKARVAAAGVLLPLLPQQISADVERLDDLISRSTPSEKKYLNKALALVKGDERLVKAIRKSANVVLPVGYLPPTETVRWLPERFKGLEIVHNERGEPPAFLKPLFAVPVRSEPVRHYPGNEFMTAAAATGVIVQNNNTSITPLVLHSDTVLYPTFMLQLLARKYNSTDDSFYVINNHGIQISGRLLETGPDYRLYPKPIKLTNADSLVFQADDILAGRVSMRSFRNKLVLLGFMANAVPFADGYISPASMGSMNNMIYSLNALLTRQYFTQPDWVYGLQRGGVLLLMVYLLLLPVKLRGLIGCGINIFLAFLLLNFSLVMMVVQNIWLPMTLLVWYLLGASLVLPLRHRIAAAVMLLRNEAARAYRDLARNYQSQGQLDVALDCLSKCPVDTVTAEPLYNLGMDYERRRQFSKALSIYERIATVLPGYRDIQERSDKLSVMPECFRVASAAPAAAGAATIIIDDAMIARPVIGRYQIERELGRGAMGMVYLGNDPKISRTVAIKTMALADEFESGRLDEVKRRFYQEAETAGQLSHPNIVTIYDVGEEHDLAYIAMDYIKGKSLDGCVEAASLLPLEEVFDIGIHIADALDYAHERKVVHRDVKPANIMYDRANHVLKIMDFGIACLTDNSKTRTGTVLGSPFYMSPEQIAGKRIDGRSDLYSLAVTLYQLFTGQLPFTGDSMATLMYQIENQKAASIRKVRPELPVCLVRIMNRAMEKDAERRFQSGRSLADALYSCAERQGLIDAMRARR